MIYGITAEPHCVLVTNCTDIPWDMSSNEHGIYTLQGKGELKTSWPTVTTTATSL